MRRRHFVMGGLSAGGVTLFGHKRWTMNNWRKIEQAINNRPQIGGAAMASDSQQIGRDIVEGLMGRALLRAIYWAEGTFPNSAGMDPYRIIFTYKLAPNYDDHPRQCIPIPGSHLCSDAAGIGQFLSTTYDGIWANNPNALMRDIPYFHPRNQDRAMAILLGNTGAYWSLAEGTTWAGMQAGVATERGAFDKAMNQAAVEWASLPLANGLSIGHSTGQSAKSLDSLWGVYQEHLNSWKNVVATS